MSLRDFIEKNVEMAIGNGYTMGRYLSLIEEKDYYMPPDLTDPSCHPLETIVLGQKITDCINKQIADELEVSLSWVDGFVDGYAGEKKDTFYLNCKDRSYLEGYKHGYEMFQFIRELELSDYAHDLACPD